MKFMILLLTSPAWCQSDTLPVEDLEKDGAVQAVHKALDDRFSIFGGTVTGTVYITTAAYVNTCQVATLCADQTWTGNNSFGSSVTFTGNVFGTINRSTFTTMPTAVSFTNTGFATCLAGSTITFTTQAVPVDIVFNGSIHRPGPDSTGNTYLRVLVDGAVPTGFVNQVCGIGVSANSLFCPASFNFRTNAALSAGEHSFCLQVYTSAGNGGACDQGCRFEAREAH